MVLNCSRRYVFNLFLVQVNLLVFMLFLCEITFDL
uniref:Uncharacterized protein n=1 Tax=Arundo donax TaxID=35708 RepID=A0A0A8ZZ08_ARUDO